MAIKLVINKTKLPHPIDREPKAIPIPMTHNGGTKEAAIATPASHAAIFLYHKAKNATNHEANAIHRSMSVGCVLLRISGVAWVSGMIRVAIIATHIPSKILVIRSRSE